MTQLPSQPAPSFNIHGLIVPLRIFGVILILPGLFLALVSVMFYRTSSAFLATAMTTQGMIVDIRSDNSNGATLYFCHYKYTDQQGTKHLGEYMSTIDPNYSVGDKLDILYDPNKPGSGIIKSFYTFWLAPIVLGVLLGFDLFLVSTFLFLIPFVIKRISPKPAVTAYPYI